MARFVKGRPSFRGKSACCIPPPALDEKDIVGYSYLGLNEFVRAEYLEPEVELTYLEQDGDDPAPPPNAPGDKYVGLDQFNRVRDQRWLQGVTPLERVQYTFDRNSNRVSRGNRVAQGYAAKQDEYYTYDALNQLTQLQRGTLTYDGSGAVTGITPDSWQEDFTLDPTGNWNEYTNPDLGTQERTHDAANEIVEIDEDDAFVSYDAAGNMTKTPKPSDWEAAFDLTYDAWNRLVQVDAGDVAIYAYDGLNRRTTKTIDETVRHFYYGDQWQILEERLDEETSADRQFVWGMRYRDDLVLRDRTTEENLDERIYVLHDFFHPTTLVDAEGEVLQRIGYNAYGTSRLTEQGFDVPASDDYKWELRFGGYGWDSETLLYHVRHRAFHSELGIWLQRDPDQDDQQAINAYEYVDCQPINKVDPDGLQGTTGNPATGNCPPGYTSAGLIWIPDKPTKRTIEDVYYTEERGVTACKGGWWYYYLISQHMKCRQVVWHEWIETEVEVCDRIPFQLGNPGPITISRPTGNTRTTKGWTGKGPYFACRPLGISKTGPWLPLDLPCECPIIPGAQV